MRTRDKRMALTAADERREINPPNPAWQILPDGSWKGERCFIIAGGPSLEGFDFERLRGKGRIIVINKGFMFVPFADVLFFMDHASFYTWIKRGLFGKEIMQAWDEFKGLRIFLNLRGRDVRDAHSIRSVGKRGYPKSIKSGLFHGNNCGVGALQLALCLGADPIFLMGYDMKHDGKKTHWHGGYRRPQPDIVFRSYIHEMDYMAELIKGRGRPSVINVNPNSALKSFPFGNLDEVLS